MIICPSCQNRIDLPKKSGCAKCGFCIKKQNGIFLFGDNAHEPLNYDERLEDQLYKFENQHFWFIARKKIIMEAFAKFGQKDEEILEIGAGTGDIARELISNGYNKVSVGEIHLNGLLYAKTYGIKNLFRFNLLNSPFESHYDVVSMFDVLEHIEDQELALQKIHQTLKKDGRLIITVPAHKWLWSSIDQDSGHLRRYENDKLKDLLESNSFKVLYITNFFTLILPILFLRSILNKKSSNKKLENRNGFQISQTSNNILKYLTKIDRLLFRYQPINYGGSILAIARKK